MKYSNKITYLLILLSIVEICSHPIFAQNFQSKVDNLIAKEFKDENGPGGVFMVSKNGKPVYQKAVGKANLEVNVNLTSEYLFQLGSMTKQFTAIAILMLEEQGKLSTSDSISKFIPDYPMGNKITIHHLLTHTSGVKDYTKMKSLWDIAQKDMTPKMLVDFFKNEPSEFLPGEKFEYNNSGYVLLGYILEIVTQETYEKFIEEKIFQKIGMLHSYYGNDEQIIAKRAYGYSKEKEVYVNKNPISLSIPFSAGSLMSTTEDMLKWQNALNKNVLLSAESIKKAFSKYKLNNGEAFNYGYGWRNKDIKGTPTREHGGSIFGFKTMGIYIPSEDIYVLGFSNCDCNSPTQLVTDISKLALESLTKSK